MDDSGRCSETRVVFPKEVREELHEELEELKDHGHHTEEKKDGEA